jgi:hypothetical protein
MNNYNIKVYIAGAYSADNVIDILKNIGRGEKLAAEIFNCGFSPFCPWFDKSFIIHEPESDYKVEQFYEYSIAWLLVSDCLLLADGWENSKGTLKEIEIAKEMKKPIYYNIIELLDNYQK